jgi:hypothetical protein
VRVVFDWSYERLATAQAQLFRHLGLHPGTEFSLHAAAAVGGINVEQALALLEELSEVHLIEPIARERFRFHDLLRAYAAERAGRDDSPASCKRATRRLFDWYAYTAAMADNILFPDHSTLSHELGPAPKVKLTPFTHAEALRWFHLERANLIAATLHASDHAQPHETLRLADGLREFLFHRVYWDDLLTICDIALMAARRSGDRAAEARNHVMRSERHTCVANWEQAQEDARRGIELAQALGNAHIQSYGLNALGWCYLRQHRYSEAIEMLRAGLPHARGLEVVAHREGLRSSAGDSGNAGHAGRRIAESRPRRTSSGALACGAGHFRGLQRPPSSGSA